MFGGSLFSGKSKEEMAEAQRIAVRNEKFDEAVARAMVAQDMKEAMAQYSGGELRGMARLFPEALYVARQVLGSRHHRTLTLLASYGGVLHDLGRREEAAPCYAEALQGRRLVHGDRHETTLGNMHDYALCLTELGRLDEATTLTAEVLAGRAATLGDDHLDTLNTLGNYGMLLVKRGHRVEGVKRLLTVALALRDEYSLPPSHAWRVKFEGTLRTEEAEQLSEEMETQKDLDSNNIYYLDRPANEMPDPDDNEATDAPPPDHTDDAFADDLADLRTGLRKKEADRKK